MTEEELTDETLRAITRARSEIIEGKIIKHKELVKELKPSKMEFSVIDKILATLLMLYYIVAAYNVAIWMRL